MSARRTSCHDEALNSALDALAAGKPHMFVDYLRRNEIPLSAYERLADALKKACSKKPSKAFSEKPSKRAVELADAFEYYHKHKSRVGDREAHANACRLFNIKNPRVLDNVLARCRLDVNEVLRRRGVLPQ